MCFFVIIYNRFVDSSKCDPRDFDPQSKKIVPVPLPAPGRIYIGLVSGF